VHSLHAAQVWRALPLFVKLALALIDSCCTGGAGKPEADAAALQEYLDILPRNHSSALAWTAEQLMELQDPHMVGKVQAEQANVRAHYIELCSVLQAPPTEETLCWAIQTVISRAFAFHESQGRLSFTSVQEANTACLLPLIDSANHDPDIQTYMTFDEDKDVFLLSAAGAMA
jgi:hypothetical protein